MRISIVSIGDELVAGDVLDRNAPWLASRLARFGLRVRRKLTVGDDMTALVGALREALDGSDLVIATGGLGPTVDDLTRQAAAEALGVPLERSVEALDQIRAFFARWDRPMHPANEVQAMVPQSCTVLSNPRGTAPGFRYRGDRVDLVVLPGVPAEMEAMFVEHVEPGLRGRGVDGCTVTRAVQCFGVSEAHIGQLIEDLMARGRNPAVGTAASEAIITVRVRATAAAEEEAARLADRDVAEVRRRIGQAAFGQGEDTLQEVAGRLALDRGVTVATAESCTGGGIAERLTRVAGSSAYFIQGYVTYANDAKVSLLGVPPGLLDAEGAVSEAVARAMAEGCRRRAGTDLGLSVTGIAGPSGGSPGKPVGLTYIGLADERRTEVGRHLFGGHLSRQEIRDRACKTALNMLRLRLINPTP